MNSTRACAGDKDKVYFSRRSVLRFSIASMFGGALSGCIPQPPENFRPQTRYERLACSNYLDRPRILVTLEDAKAFTEGPAVDANGDVYFSSVLASKIYCWNPLTGKLKVFRENTNEANGLIFDPEGRLLVCEGGAGRLTRTNMQTGEIEVLVDSYGGLALAPPNDLCFDIAGRIYFTSRPARKDATNGNVNAVYRLDPNGTIQQLLVWPDVHMPNGIVLSPDEQTLYLIEAHPEANHHRDIRAYDLRNGEISNERVLVNFYPGRSGDGMCIDVEGNLYVAAGLHRTRNTSETLDTRPGIHVISPAGQLLAFRETPFDTVTNCTFGGSDRRTLYVTCGASLLSMRSRFPGV